MLSRILSLLFISVTLFGATVRLYLKDGTYQSTSEYHVLTDRVRYMSTERGEWEEIPLELVDLDIHGDKLETVKVAESKIVDNKKRSVLKVLSPIPLVPGKETLEIDGDKSAMQIADTHPEFFFRLSNVERFGLIKVTPTKKGSRVVENIQIVPVTKEIVQEMQQVDTFKKQVGELVYRIWPENALEPGEYALVEYTEEMDKINIQVWDFSIKPGK